MSTYPEIKPEDIREGYHIRVEYADGNDLTAQEFWETSISCGWGEGNTYYLMYRPVTLHWP